MCLKENKYCGTEFFETFATTNVLSRPEISDIYLAKIQKYQYVMLSMETASSNYPIETVKMINLIKDDQL